MPAQVAIAVFAFAQVLAPIREATGNTDAQAHQRRALAAAGRKDWTTAFREMQAAAEAEPRNAAFLYNLGSLHYNNQEFESAAPWFRRAHEIDRGDLRIHLALASALEAAGNLDAAIAEFDGLVQRHSGEARAYSERAATVFRLGRLDDAKRDVDRAIALDPGLAAPWYLRGKVLENSADLSGALQAYLRAVQIEPGHVNAHYRIALVAKKLGRDDEASRHAAIHASLKARINAANAILFGSKSLAGGDFKSAEQQFAQAVQSDPKNLEALYHLALVRQKQGRVIDAAATFKEMLQIDPDCALAHAGLGLILAARKDESNARSHLGLALKHGADSFDVNLTAGRGWFALGDWAAAEAPLLKALALFPDDPGALAELFQLYAVSDQREPAQRYASLASMASADPRVLYRVALFWASGQEFERAREALRKAAELAPNDEKILRLISSLPGDPGKP